MWGLSMVSEKKMRKEAAELLGDNLEAELALMSSHKNGGEVIRDVPIAYILALWEKIKGLLDQNCNENGG